MRQCLFSVPAFVREGCEVHFAPELNGGSWLKIPSEVERLPIENVDGKHFRLKLRVRTDEKLSTRDKQVVNYFTQTKFGFQNQRILDETKKRGLVDNMDYHIGVQIGTGWENLMMQAQKAPAPQQAHFRAKKVGAFVRCDAKTIPQALAKHSRIKYMLVIKDSHSRAVVRYYLTNLKDLAGWVRKYRNLLASKGHTLNHFQADGPFWTEALESLAGENSSFDYSFSAPYCQFQNGLAEADIKIFEKDVTNTNTNFIIVVAARSAVASPNMSTIGNKVVSVSTPPRTRDARIRQALDLDE